jgi:hypothetical protein
MKYKYKGVIFDDVVLKGEDGNNTWSQICCRCKTRHEFKESRFAHMASDETCGIEGCNRKAEYYIDFKDGELEKVESEIIKPKDLYPRK